MPFFEVITPISREQSSKISVKSCEIDDSEDLRKHFPEKPLIAGNRFLTRVKLGLRPGFYFLRTS
jgi:hypothetical protein